MSGMLSALTSFLFSDEDLPNAAELERGNSSGTPASPKTPTRFRGTAPPRSPKRTSTEQQSRKKGGSKQGTPQLNPGNLSPSQSYYTADDASPRPFQVDEDFEVEDNTESLHVPGSFSGFFKELFGLSSSRSDEYTAMHGEEDELNKLESEEDFEVVQPANASPERPLSECPVFTDRWMPKLVLKDRSEDQDNPGLLRQDLAEELRKYLPPLLQEASSWRLDYSTIQHGFSISTLYRNCLEKGPELVIVKNDLDDLFGAFASDSLHADRGFYGDGTCFLWRKSEKSLDVYRATGINMYMIYTEAHCIAFGGGAGRFGLWFDEELDHGHSEASKCYDNESLTSFSDFRIQNLEIWSFEI